MVKINLILPDQEKSVRESNIRDYDHKKEVPDFVNDLQKNLDPKNSDSKKMMVKALIGTASHETIIKW